MLQRDFGTRTGIQVSALGLGCWAIGGPWEYNGQPAGWGEVDDGESIRAIRRALDLGVTLFDTADLYLIHDGIESPEHARAVVEVLEALVDAGKIRWYGSSMADPAIARAMASGPHMVAVQHELSVLRGEMEALEAAEELGLASLNRTPLAMGLLGGRYRPGALPGADDVRRHATWMDFFDQDGAMERWLELIDEARGELSADGRSLAQGALGWIWGRSPATIPIPGFRTVAQVEENAAAARFGPLPAERMERLRNLLGEPVAV
jgi:aryl-alcohol dehydrogenase-like predicted oxidoreductase